MDKSFIPIYFDFEYTCGTCLYVSETLTIPLLNRSTVQWLYEVRILSFFYNMNSGCYCVRLLNFSLSKPKGCRIFTSYSERYCGEKSSRKQPLTLPSLIFVAAARARVIQCYRLDGWSRFYKGFLRPSDHDRFSWRSI